LEFVLRSIEAAASPKKMTNKLKIMIADFLDED
jgi:hypothetical protein